MMFDTLNGMETETFGQRLRRLRRKKKLSQRELARRVGLTNGTISQAEKGTLWVDQAPSIDIVRRLARELNVEETVLVPYPTVPAAFDTIFAAEAAEPDEATITARVEALADTDLLAYFDQIKIKAGADAYQHLIHQLYAVILASGKAFAVEELKRQRDR